jgi:hypothetical protein
MVPSSRFASSLKPSVAYLDLNLCALWKKQTTLPSLAYAGIPYQVFGQRSGALALTIDLREHVAFPGRLVLVRARFRLQLLGALLHRSSFLGGESRRNRTAPWPSTSVSERNDSDRVFKGKISAATFCLKQKGPVSGAFVSSGGRI